MEMLLVGCVGGSAFDVVHSLRKARWDVEDCRVELQAERAQKVPKVFTRIHMHFVISGKNIPEAKVKRAVELSAEKYCSASIMFKQSATITHDYELIQT